MCVARQIYCYTKQNTKNIKKAEQENFMEL